MSSVEEKKVEEKKDDTEVLEPSYTVRYQVLGKDDELRTFAQRPLSFFGKMELFSLLGATLDEAMKDGSFSVGELLGSSREFQDTDFMISFIVKAVEFAPDFLKNLYCIALAVPKGEREYVQYLMELPEEEGGMSDDDGVEILDTFVDQNWEAMYDFFGEKIMPLVQKVLSKAQDTQSSKPLSPTPRRTRKR